MVQGRCPLCSQNFITKQGNLPEKFPLKEISQRRIQTCPKYYSQTFVLRKKPQLIKMCLVLTWMPFHLPIIKLFGRFFEWQPNMNNESSFFFDKNSFCKIKQKLHTYSISKCPDPIQIFLFGFMWTTYNRDLGQ